jgi:SAM-dependent methyltransferase
MALIGGVLGYRLLRFIAPQPEGVGATACNLSLESDLAQHFGPDFLAAIQGKVVIDFGSGAGEHAVAMAKAGAARVIGLEIQARFRELGRSNAQAAGVGDKCVFLETTDESADFVVSKDAFEHFDDPANILEIMARLLKPGGTVMVSFGPTWLHPRGGHLFSVFPWAHLLFTERALLRWRGDFKSDGATRFGEVAGGLNQMTIRRFERLVTASPLEFVHLETVPIRALGILRWPILREFGSSLVRCKLVASTS